MASRRRRRKSIGKVIVDVERRVRRVEKRPGAKRLRANVVTTEKLGYRAVTTKVIQVDAVDTENIATDAVTANEAEFGVTVVSDTDPVVVKEGTTVVDPDTGAQKVYSEDISAFVTVTDPAAQAAADSKSAVYYQDNEPAGTAYEVGDIWIDTNDNDKLYAWDGTDWVLSQDSAAAQATADGKAKTYVQDNEPTGGAYNAGDLWIDTNDGNKLYRYSGSAWVSAQDGAISTAQSTANGKNKVYYNTSAPGSTANTAGDIWWQYASGIVIGQYVGAGGTSWTSAPIGNAVIANLDAGKITTGYLDVAGTVKITTSATASGSANVNAARIEISSLGFYAYDGSTATVSITNSGTALFTGTITGSSFTGGTFRTAASGTRIEMTSGSSNYIFFYGSTSQPGVLRIDNDNINLWAPASTIAGGATVTMYSDTYTSSPSGVFIAGGTSKALNFTMSNTSITLNQGTYGLNISSAGTKAVGASGESSEVIRNIRITQTAPTSGGDSSAYTNGTVVLVREA